MLLPVLWRVAALWRVGLRLSGLLLPPALALVGLFRGWKKGSLGDWKKISPVILGVVALINWVVLACFIANEKVGVGLDYRLSRWTPALLGLSLVSVVVSIGAYAFRRSFLIANSLLLFMWFDIGYAPNHWLDRVDFGIVSVNGQSVPAAVYIGNPTLSEAEAIAFVHVPGIGNYFVDFSSENFRESSSHEAVVLYFGAWTWKPMNQGQFHPPLPYLHVNECRIPMSDGRVMTVAF
jgi:hypothetical protein